MTALIRDVQLATAKQFKVPFRVMVQDFRGNSDHRHVAMFLAREITGKSRFLIAQRFNRKDPTTVLYAERKMRRLVETDHQLAENVQAIRERLAA